MELGIAATLQQLMHSKRSMLSTSLVAGLHRGVVPAAVLVAVLIFCVAGAVLWLLYRRTASRFGRLPPLVGGAYYRQTDSQATESDGNVLITDLEAPGGE